MDTTFMNGFWGQLKLPIISLSPMDGVTDAPMRFVTAKHGRTPLSITEFTHVQGLWLGKLKVFTDFLYDEIERPVVAQIFGSNPKDFYKAAFIVCELGFDGIDINMGCPAKSIVERGGGASLINTPEIAQKIISETKKGIKDWSEGKTLENLELEKEKIEYIAIQRKLHNNPNPERTIIPVSVKTRVGFEEIAVKEWVKHLLEAKPATISIHGRTLKQMYAGEANWEAIGSVSSLIRSAGVIYLGNGDVKNYSEALEKVTQYGVSGVLIGRAAFGNPWVFRRDIKEEDVTTEMRLKVALEHARLHAKLKPPGRFVEVRKHLGWYCKGFDGAKELRVKLIRANTIEELEEVLREVTF